MPAKLMYGSFLPFNEYLLHDTIRYRSVFTLGMALAVYADSS